MGVSHEPIPHGIVLLVRFFGLFFYKAHKQFSRTPKMCVLERGWIVLLGGIRPGRFT